MRTDERTAERIALANKLRATLVRTGVSQQEVAESVGLGATAVNRWCDPEHTLQLGLADARRLPPAVRMELTRWLAEADGCEVVRRAAPVPVIDDMAHAADVMRGAGDVARNVLEAIADNYISAAEAGRTLPVVRELTRVVLGLEQRLELALRNRGDGVRSRVPGLATVRPADADEAVG